MDVQRELSVVIWHGVLIAAYLPLLPYPLEQCLYAVSRLEWNELAALVLLRDRIDTLLLRYLGELDVPGLPSGRVLV